MKVTSIKLRALADEADGWLDCQLYSSDKDNTKNTWYVKSRGPMVAGTVYDLILKEGVVLPADVDYNKVIVRTALYTSQHELIINDKVFKTPADPGQGGYTSFNLNFPWGTLLLAVGSVGILGLIISRGRK